MIIKIWAILVLVLTPACVREARVPTIATYTCAAQRAQVATILQTAPAERPIVIALPSGERVYITDQTPYRIVHYDGPECEGN